MTRINRVPDRHYLAFLDLIGTRPQPPRPARVPLTFTLAEGAAAEATVPAATRVGAPPLPGETEDVVFETEQPLVVTGAALVAAFVGDAETDTYSDRTAQVTGLVDAPFPVFTGEVPTPHELYVACDPLLTAPGVKNVTLAVGSPDSVQWNTWPLSWSCWDGAAWQPLTPTAGWSAGTWRVTFPTLPPLVPCPVGGVTAGWLRLALQRGLPPGDSGLAPESVAVGRGDAVDLRLPLQPFGPAGDARWLYLSADDALATGGALATLNVTLSRPGTARAGDPVVLVWTYRIGNEWRELGRSSSAAEQVGTSSVGLRDGTRAFTRAGTVTFHVPDPWLPALHRRRYGRWLRVEVANPGGSYTAAPEIGALTVDYGWELPRVGAITAQVNTVPTAQPATVAFTGTTALDLSKDFFPLGEEPGFNDTFAVACPPELARPGTDATFALTANPDHPAVGVGTVRLVWEVADGVIWRSVATTADIFAPVRVRWPDPGASTTVNGEDGHWLRCRLVGGTYGEPAGYVEVPPPADKPGTPVTYRLTKATFAPPVARSAAWTPIGPATAVPASACVGVNDFVSAPHPLYVAPPSPSTPPPVTLPAGVPPITLPTGVSGVNPLLGAPGVNPLAGGPPLPLATVGPLFTPFTAAAEHDPALYLGFDRPYGPRPATLYLQVEPPAPEEVAADQLAELDPESQAQVSWEYSGPQGWRPLATVDGTGALADRGVVEFVGPADHVERSCFGQRGYWVRARWRRGSFPVAPQLRRVLPNTMWAVQVGTVEQEILGGSNGNPAQVFRTAQAPVQPGHQLVVRELQRPDAAEEAQLVAVEGADAVTVTVDADGRPDEVWVRWHCVPDFYRSGPADRHYTLDPVTGTVGFGDGQAGRIPPGGQNNLRISYRTGGGEAGNRATGTIVALKSGIPYIDAVTNLEPAQGGAPTEPLDRLTTRGPRVLRHRDRAVTADDLADLAFAASADVARVAAVPTVDFDTINLWLDPNAPVPTDAHAQVAAGRVGVIVVPGSADRRPAPSLGLLRQVRAYLLARCPATTDLWVAGPEWIKVTVTATVVPRSFDDAESVGARVRAALDTFLHPLTGGPDGQGWAFARKPHRSELFAVVEAVAGVDHVRTLDIDAAPESATLADRLEVVLSRALAQTGPASGGELAQWLARALVYSGDHAVTVALGSD